MPRNTVITSTGYSRGYSKREKYVKMDVGSPKTFTKGTWGYKWREKHKTKCKGITQRGARLGYKEIKQGKHRIRTALLPHEFSWGKLEKKRT